MATEKMKNVSPVVLDLGDGRMIATGEFVDVDDRSPRNDLAADDPARATADLVASYVATGRLKRAGTPPKKSASANTSGEQA
jgi:hypothetical protein